LKMIKCRYRLIEFKGTDGEIRSSARGRFNFERRFTKYMKDRGIKIKRTTGNNRKFLKSKGIELIGCPDFFLIEDGKIRFIELKSSEDTLRHSQIKWFNEFSETFDTTITFFGFDEESRDKLIGFSELHQMRVEERTRLREKEFPFLKNLRKKND